MKNAPQSRLAASILAAISAAGLTTANLVGQTDGIWNLNNNGNWSEPTNWLDGDIADGAGATADFTEVNLTSNRTATIDTTSRTLGTLLIGDSDGTHNYTIGASGGASLVFDNGLSDAVLTQASASGNNTISAPVTLTSNLVVTNNSTGTLTFSGVISGGESLILAAPGSGGITLSGTNTYTGGTTIKQGNVLANNAAAFGAGTVFLGDTSGSADATLLIGSFTVANPITVQAGSTGKLTLSNTAGGSSARPTGDILLNNDLTIAANGTRANSNAGALFSSSGTISGSGDLNLEVTGNLSTSNNNNSPQMDNLSITGAVTTTGAIRNVGAGTGRALISGAISNASSVNQDSATSLLTLSGTNTYTGATNVNAGILRITAGAALPTNNTVNVSSGGAFQLSNNTSTAFGAGSTLNISGDGGAASHGAVETTNNSNYAGAVVLQDDATIASGLSNTTLTLSGAITGSGKTLTVAGVGNSTISASIATGSGGLVKTGTGTATLSVANTYTGATTLNAGTLSLTHADALGGGGAITFAGGTLRHATGNTADYASRIVNSTGPVSIDTAGQTVSYAGNIDATNAGGLLKIGSGRLTLSGTNSFSGPIAVNGGVLAVSSTSALPATGTGGLFIDASGALDSGGAYANVQAWLDSDTLSTASTGAIALTSGSSENIDLTGYDSLSLGASTNLTYTGTLTAAGSTYRLGGGGGTLTLSGANALTGANALVINGGVTLTNANNLSGATTVSSGTLTLGGSAGGLAASAVTAGPGSTIAVTTATTGSPVTRAASLELNRATFTVAGNSTANSSDAITGALTIGDGGNSIVTLTPNATRHTLLTAGGFTREAGATALVRGANLGVNSLASQTANAVNISFGTGPTLVGGAGSNTTDGGILVGLVGDTASNGTGFGATGGLLTYDATNGLRLLGASEYKTSITSGQTQLDNVKLSKATAGAATTTLAADTTINSLSLYTSGVTGATIAVDGAGKLTLNSGVIYANSVTANTTATVSNAIDFNGREALVLAGGSNNLTLSGVLSNTGGNGLTFYSNAGRTLTLSGAAANTYTGTTTVNGGTLALGKTAGLDAITGDLLVNSGGTVSHSNSNQIADTANVTINGGSFIYRNETINNLTVTNSGSASNASSNGIALVVNGALSVSNDATLSTASATATTLTVAGATNLSNGGSLNLGRSQSTSGSYDAVATLGGGLNITHKSSGDYTAVTIGHGAGAGQSGAKLVLGGDVTFTGNATNTHTVLIDAIRGTGRQGVIELTSVAGSRVFNIGDGAASVDLRVTASMLDGAGASSLVKTGAGTLELSGANGYTGSTTISSGTLLLGAANRIADTSALVMNGGTFATGGFSETLGTLGVTASSVIDLGFGDSDLFFADSSGVAWSGSVSLSFINVTDGADSIRVGTSAAGLTGLQLGQITINGFAAVIDAQGYLSASAIPEPSAFAALAGAAGLLVASSRRRRRA